MESAPKRTPWGPSQGSTVIAEGITSVSTAGHGGIHLSRARKAQMLRTHPALSRGCSEEGNGIWFEEDCACNAVRIAFADEFDAFAERTEWARGWKESWTVENAKSSIRHWYPSVAHASGFGWSPDEYAESVRAALFGNRPTYGLPECRLQASRFSGHVVGLPTSESPIALQVSVAGITVGYFDGDTLHCGQYVRQFACDPTYLDAALDAALKALAFPHVVERLKSIIGAFADSECAAA